MSARVACVDVAALPLQLLRRTLGAAGDAPLAVVEEDHPQARVEWVSRAAAARRVRVGMRYAAALQVAGDLRAGVVPASAVQRARDEVVQTLLDHSPRVEADRERAGVFWVDPSGLGSLFGPLEGWAGALARAIGSLQLDASVCVGFARLPAWAVARTSGGVRVLSSGSEEAALASRAPLIALDAPPPLRDALLALGITRLGQFLSLPRGEVGVRFGPEARRLHAGFADALRPPMTPAVLEEPIRMEAELEPPDDDQHRLLFCVKGALHALMAELGRRTLALGALELTLELERGPPRRHRVEPAQPTRDALPVLELVRLRLAAASVGPRVGERTGARVERVVLTAEPARLDGRQLGLFAGRRRDPDAARRGIARLRAAFGDDAVTRAKLTEGWLPEARFLWEPAEEVGVPAPAPTGAAPALVRRVRGRPEPLPLGRGGRPRTDPPLTELTGPYRLQGGWWEREDVRDYFFAERADGALLWLYRDRRRRQWFLHGCVG